MFALNALPAFLSIFSAAPPKGIAPGQIKSLVTFGDSYTDVDYVWDGGLPWPKYVENYASVKLYPYAISGGPCSNKITPRPYPSLKETQLPKYFDSEDKPGADETLYTVWIGPNDLGVGALLTGQAEPGVTIVDTSSCAVQVVKTLYESGARNFLFQNVAPLQRTTLYSAETYHSLFWTLPHNATAWHYKMEQLVNGANKISYHLLKDLAAELPDAHVGYYDSYALFEDIVAHPSNYLNGTASFSFTAPVKSCVFPEGADVWTTTPKCKIASAQEADSYIWYDELHPSEQTNRVVAQQVTEIIEGKENKFTTWFS